VSLKWVLLVDRVGWSFDSPICEPVDKIGRSNKSRKRRRNKSPRRDGRGSSEEEGHIAADAATEVRPFKKVKRDMLSVEAASKKTDQHEDDGVSQKPTTASVNGNSSSSSSAFPHANGNGSVTVSSHAKPMEHVVTKEHGLVMNKLELLRVMAQSLQELGMSETAATLEKESGVTLESPFIRDVEEKLLLGSWDDSLRVLKAALEKNDGEIDIVDILLRCETLVYKEKYFELLCGGKAAQALLCLQKELGPRCGPLELAHFSSLLMYVDSPFLMEKLGRGNEDGNREGRSLLIRSFRQMLPNSIVLPEGRLLTLMDHAIQEQTKNCFYNGVSERGQSKFCFPLVHDLREIAADLSNMPTKIVQALTVHDQTTQIWRVEFNHGGDRLASTGTNTIINIYSVSYGASSCENGQGVMKENGVASKRKGSVLQPWTTLRHHKSSVSCLAWSPNDKMLLSADLNGRICLWITFDKSDDPANKLNQPDLYLKTHRKRVTSLRWAADTGCFFSASVDNTLHMYNLKGELLSHWGGAPFYDICYSDKYKLIIASCGGGRMIRVFNCQSSGSSKSGRSRKFKIRERTSQCKLGCFEPPQVVTCMHLTADEETLITTLLGGKIVEWNLRTGLPRNAFAGANHGNAVIRASIGGFRENLIASGTVDGKICIWERSVSQKSLDADFSGNMPLHILPAGHTQPVNSISWSPVDPCMLVSGSDDGTIKVWHP